MNGRIADRVEALAAAVLIGDKFQRSVHVSGQLFVDILAQMVLPEVVLVVDVELAEILVKGSRVVEGEILKEAGAFQNDVGQHLARRRQEILQRALFLREIVKGI